MLTNYAEFDEGDLGKDHDKGKSEVSGMVSILGDSGQHTSPSVRPRPKARDFSSFLAANASKRLTTAVSLTTVNEAGPRSVLEHKAGVSQKETPLQLLFLSIWERIQKVCVLPVDLAWKTID